MKIQQESIHEYPKICKIREHFSFVNYSCYTVLLNKMDQEGIRVKQVYFWATDNLKLSEMMENDHHRSLSSTARLDRYTQLTTGSPWHHEDSRLLIWIARGPKKSSQQKQTSYHRLSLTLKSNNTLTQLWIFCENLDLLSWAIRPFLSDQITYMYIEIVLGVTSKFYNSAFSKISLNPNSRGNQ